MFAWRRLFLLTLLGCSAPLFAQSEAELQNQMREAEARLEESVRQMREVEQSRSMSGAEAEEVELQMYEAERQLAEAARQIADLSYQRLPNMSVARRVEIVRSDRAVLGVNIGDNNNSGPVEGVKIAGVSPGGAAAEAGLRSGDVIVAVNGQSMSAADGQGATRELLDFMQGVEEGDVLDIDYLRNGKVESVEVSPRAMVGQTFAFGGPDFGVHVAPGSPMPPVAAFGPSIAMIGGNGWGDMEMVPLTEKLGRYFGTDTGLLVVRGPDDEAFKLQDGDVIQAIGGRTPSSVSHAMRILGSYQEGETLDIVIMRDKREQTLSIDVPDNRTGQYFNRTGPASAVRVIEVAPAAPPAPPAPVPDH